jgi:hypothetical protein
MPRKSRRSRRARGGQTAPRPAAPVGAKEPAQVKASPVKQATAGRPAQPGPDLSQQFRHLRSDVRWTFVVAAICLAVLIGIHFVLR